MDPSACFSHLCSMIMAPFIASSFTSYQLLGLFAIFSHALIVDPASAVAAHQRQLLQQQSSSVQGMDVSAYQQNVDWQTAYSNGAQFAYIKATEGTGYTNPYFTQQYDGSYQVGMIRGAYHFARPDISDGATQATYFLNNGGRRSSDGQTLPGALDIEYNPSCGTSSCTTAQSCYGYTQADMGKWIQDFVNTYYAATGVYPVIYSTADWYNTCVGTSGDFSSKCPFWIACYCDSITTYPYKWGVYTFWQYADSGVFPGDQDVFNGTIQQLHTLANNG